MKHSCNALAVVLDEYGGMTGIITIHDLVEQLVGDLVDDEPVGKKVTLIENIDSKTWKIHGDASLEDVAQALGVTFPLDDYDTFNGLIFGALGAIPQNGSTVKVETADLVINVKINTRPSGGNCHSSL